MNLFISIVNHSPFIIQLDIDWVYLISYLFDRIKKHLPKSNDLIWYIEYNVIEKLLTLQMKIYSWSLQIFTLSEWMRRLQNCVDFFFNTEEKSKYFLLFSDHQRVTHQFELSLSEYPLCIGNFVEHINTAHDVTFSVGCKR